MYLTKIRLIKGCMLPWYQVQDDRECDLFFDHLGFATLAFDLRNCYACSQMCPGHCLPSVKTQQ